MNQENENQGKQAACVERTRDENEVDNEYVATHKGILNRLKRKEVKIQQQASILYGIIGILVILLLLVKFY